MDIFAIMVQKIIEEQEMIIGPIALEQAQKVPGLKVNWQQHEINFQGNKTEILENLVKQYKSLFGQASVEVCREAVRNILTQIPSNQLPPLLR